MTRRDFLGSAARTDARRQQGRTPRPPTKFQIACMTLPYSRFPLGRGARGHQGGRAISYVAWGTTHKEDGKDVPVLADGRRRRRRRRNWRSAAATWASNR